MSQLLNRLSQYWDRIQGTLFPQLEEELDPLTKKQQQLVTVLELVRIEEFLPDYRGCAFRPHKTRSAIARSFVAKMIYNMDATTALIERLHTDKSLRRICGWESITQEQMGVQSTDQKKKGRPKKGEAKSSPEPTRIKK